MTVLIRYNYCIDHNHEKQYGKEGYNPEENGHELGHYAILQSPIPSKPRVVMVGKSNAWFVDGNMEKSLKIVKDLEKNIPSKDHYDLGNNFANRLNAQIRRVGHLNKNAENLFRNNRVGLNRIWMQTGSDTEEAKLSIEAMESSLIDRCHTSTEKIIRLLDPCLVFLFGNKTDKHCAWKLFDKSAKDESFIIKRCPHPSGSNVSKISEAFLKGYNEAEEKGLLNH